MLTIKNHRRQLRPIILLVVFLFLSLQKIVASTDIRISRIDTLLSKYHQYRYFNGVALVAENGRVIYQKSFGFADFENQIPNTIDTRFPIASLSKAFTSLIIMQLVEEEKLQLDDCVVDHFFNFPQERGDLITIENLLSHSSGIPEYTSIPGFWNRDLSKSLKPDQLVALFADSTLEFAPGQGFQYNNSGYVLLGRIIEAVTAESYGRNLQKRIFDPLQMQQSGYQIRPGDSKKYAKGYNRTLFNNPPAPAINASILYSAGGLYSTVRDLLLWDQALYEEELVSSKYLNQIFEANWNGYGYGWQIADLLIGQQQDTLKAIYHNGEMFGFRSRIVRIPEHRKTIILLQNISVSTLNQIADKILTILYKQPFEYPRQPAAELVAHQMKQNSVQYGSRFYYTLRKSNPDSVFFSEGSFNNVGYQLLSINHYDEAIAIFRMNVDAYSSSANTYDSLAEAYMRSGNYKLAKRYYQMVYEKLPGDLNIGPVFKRILLRSAERNLERLKKLIKR